MSTPAPATYILETPIVLDAAELTREDLNRNELEAHFGIDVFATAAIRAKYEDPADTNTLEPHFWASDGTKLTPGASVETAVNEVTGIGSSPLRTTDNGVSPFEKLLKVSDAAAGLGNYQASASWTSEIPAVISREAVAGDASEWFKVGALASYFQYTTTSFAYSDFGHKEMYGNSSLTSGQQLQKDQLLTMIRRVLAGDETDTNDNITDSQNQFEDLRLLLLNGIRDQWITDSNNPPTDDAEMLVAGDKLVFIFHKKLSHDSSQLEGDNATGVTSFDPNSLTLKVAVSVEIVV
jgi:hypothetical protein